MMTSQANLPEAIFLIWYQRDHP